MAVSSFRSLKILSSRIKDGTFHEIIDDWKWIFGYSARYKGAIALYVLLGILSTSLGLAGSVAGKYVIDIITGYQTSKLVVLLVIMIGGSIISLIFDSIVNRLSVKLSIEINNDIQADIFDKIIDADWLSLNKYSNGDILNRFNSDVSTVSGNAISWLPTIILTVYRFLATFFVLLYYDWIMALIAVASAPFMILASRFVLKKQRDYSSRVRQMSSNLMTFETETFYNIDTIKSFGATGQYSKKMRWWQEKYKDISLKYNLFTIKTNIFMSVLAMFVQFAAFGYCLFRMWSHSITYGTMTLFLQQRSQLSSAFSSMVSIIPAFLNSSVSAHRIRELTELPKEKHIKHSSGLDDCLESGLSVCMDHVSFVYPAVKQAEDEHVCKAAEESGSMKKVIMHSNFAAHPGEIVALVGASGEGKTTLIRLILGLIQPDEGQVCLSSADGLSVDVNADTRHLFAYVPQGNTLLSGTIAENMRMVREDATDDDIIEALKIACAWEFVEKLPDQVNTVLGERG
ncbi:MAG: ABC transporter ATP-binding protein, partial [Lachnospiraceae bacterium]|nr:ABC transporter ATP-binding protein [Lachnospiraceae bacterium]